MPYLNKRNRFVQAAKQFADNAAAQAGDKSPDYSAFTKTELLAIAQSIGMKGIPTWVLKDFKSAVSRGVYDLTSILANQTTPV